MSKFYQLGIILLFVTASLTWIGCGDDESATGTQIDDDFDRSAMLEHWVDGFIIPGYRTYSLAIDSLKSKSSSFVSNPSISTLNNLRNSYRFAYNAWQEVSMFEIGKAEEISLRNFTNIYPTNTEEILNNISSASYNLELPSTISQQGFPAIEYLIYGIVVTDQEVVDLYNNDDRFKDYLIDLTDRLSTLTNLVYTDWTSGYRETFIADGGSSASSSVNRMVNDYLFYYERFLRAGKIAIPAGVFSGSPLSMHVEAKFTTPLPINKSLYLTAFSSFQNFFSGDSKYIGSGPSLGAYLDYISNLTDGADVRGAIDNAIDNVNTVSTTLNNDLQKQVTEDNSKMLATYDALQAITRLLKVDMLSALNISVDYVDADGD